MRKILLLALLSTFYLGAFCQTEISRAEAMFIYNFSRLIEWPANYKTGPFIIGVYGSAAILGELKTYTTGKRVGSQPITVRTYNSPAEISTCHILVIPFNSTKHMANILPQLENKSTLVITEKSGAISQGAAINFLVVGNNLKFELSPGNATKYGIKLSSKLGEMAFKTY
ncbi:MAG: YfiR family protein [Bacteroidales bacterium]|nr:YfiR family protein [Bacteroidales bacterium]